MKTIPRRTFLAASGFGAATLVTGMGTQIALGQSSGGADKVIVIHLRGGADGLSMTPPYGDSSYYDARPNTAVPPPGSAGGALPLTSASSGGKASFPTGLDGVVGMHPALEPIYSSLWTSGQLAVVVAAGLPDATRSHFSAERYVSRGGPKGSIAQGGWLGRAADSMPSNGPITSIHGRRSGALVDGSHNTVELLDGLTKFGFDGLRNRNSHPQQDLAQAAITAMYGGGADEVSRSGMKALEVIEQVADLTSERAAEYPSNQYATALQEFAVLNAAGISMRGAALRRGAWDHHRDLKASFTDQAGQLASGIRAFADDTGLEGVTLVVVTEFGRTVGENSGQGTDHGLGFSALVMGAGIRGGVYGDDYPERLAAGDARPELPVLTDYRKMLSEVLTKRAGITNLSAVFPDYRQNGVLGLAR